jgi:hypothetical protein
MAVPPSNWFFMVGLLERFSCGVYYLTPECARPWRAADAILEQRFQPTKLFLLQESTAQIDPNLNASVHRLIGFGDISRQDAKTPSLKISPFAPLRLSAFARENSSLIL